VDHIVDEPFFSSPYKKLPANNGESWGYEDQAVFNKVLEMQKVQEKPYFNMLLTLSTHNPFLINNRTYYEKMYNQRMQSNQLSPEQKKWASGFKNQLVSVLNADDALKDFFQNYSKRPDYENTIFVITGDHSMPEITLESNIDRFHVPLMIYSPLLKEPKLFKKTTSHFDIAPSILAFYRNNYKIHTPSTVTWIGKGFTPDLEVNKSYIPIMQSKDMMVDFVSGKYYLHNDKLFTLNNSEEEDYNDEATLKTVSKQFSRYKSMNSKFYKSGKLMPDSVMTNFMKKTRAK
jgi:phosphoglycerol transferase MdoB-like AlkP superfamily enzyme